jgi:hypothetical protein
VSLVHSVRCAGEIAAMAGLRGLCLG